MQIEWNGRFSTQLGLAKLSMEVKLKWSFFHEKIKPFQGKKRSLFVFLLGATYVQKGSEMKFSSLPEEIWFCLIFLDVSSYNLFRIVVFVVTARRAPVNSISWLFRWSSSCKKAIITFANSDTLFFLRVWRLHAKLTKNTSSHSQLSYKLEKKNIVKWLTLTGKETKRNTRKKLSRSNHLMMSIFSLFRFIASMKILTSISW